MVITQSFEYEEVLGLKFGYSPFGRPKMCSHIYFVDGLLIDTGHRKMRKKILSDTQKLSVEQMFITHFHEDHTGNIKPLREMHSCVVYAPQLCCQIMKNPPKLSLAQKLTWGDREPCYDLKPIHEVIETNKFHFRLIPIPGHSPDMVALYEPERKWLFSADLFIHSSIGYVLNDESIMDQIESTRTVLKLDFDVMFCSHRPQLSNAKHKLKSKLNFLESFFHDVSMLYDKGYSPKEIFNRLRLKENWYVKLLSGGKLSKMNMVKSVIRDLKLKTT